MGVNVLTHGQSDSDYSLPINRVTQLMPYLPKKFLFFGSRVTLNSYIFRRQYCIVLRLKADWVFLLNLSCGLVFFPNVV